jgi:serine/threonine-protein kinase
MELEVLGDRYELQEPIGRGGMATIYRAVDLRMGRTVAAKILREVYSSDPKFVTRFQREARAASALQHPNIVQVFDYGQSGDSYYIVMEFVEGADLRRYLKKRGMLDNERAIEIAHDVALGLGAAHKRGIVHRDVKPQNIMLNDSGMVKLTDFGIASMYKDAEAERLTTTGMTLGTVQYYAPEQAQGEIVSPAADIYAMGIVLYEMLAGRTPFDGETPVAVAMRHIQDIPDPPSRYNPRISPGLERIILRCLEKDPRDRYRDGDALAYALENVARAPGRRATGANAPISRPPQFAPLGLPSNEGRISSGGGPAVYGGPAVATGPGGRQSRVQSQPLGPRNPYGPGATFGNAPTYQDFDDGFGLGMDPGGATMPHGPAPGTLPRTGSAGGRTSGPFGAPSGPNGGQRKNGAIVAVIVGAAVLLLGLTCFLVFALTDLGHLFAGKPQTTPIATVQQVTVPNFVGMNKTAAEAKATEVQLQVQEVATASDQPKDTVIAQSLAANQPAPINSTITLTISSGPGNVIVPDVSNLPLADAEAKLDAVKLPYTVSLTYSQTVAAGNVVNTNPPANSSVAPGTRVTISVSKGVQPTPTTVVTPSPTPIVTPSPTATP